MLRLYCYQKSYILIFNRAYKLKKKNENLALLFVNRNVHNQNFIFEFHREKFKYKAFTPT